MKYNVRKKADNNFSLIPNKHIEMCMFCHHKPKIWYEPGATMIKCECKATAVPDYDPKLILELWNTKWFEQGIISYKT